ncbi:MAG TPA: VCBS repeat-containing protein [Urbifossiella sp.]|nr:VCBS repeat-containing protein [Urbifossiella sp.]
MTAVDTNGDGSVGLLISSPMGDALVLAGNGDGTLRPYTRLGGRVAVAVADADGDGRDEYALADRAGDRVVLRADDSTAFEQGRGDGVDAPTAVRFADLNRDGVPDLIVANGGANAVLVYPGLGGGRFDAPRRYFVGTEPGGITVADVNGDGVPDLVVANGGSEDVSLLFGRGQGRDWDLTAGPRLRAGAGPMATAVADVNGDGIADILVANGGADTVYLLPGVGLGFFDDRRPVVFHTGSRPVDLFVGAFDSAGGLDLVTANAGSADLTLFPGFGAPRAVPTGSAAVRAVAGDFTGDGAPDLLVAGADGRFALMSHGPAGFGLTMAFASGLTAVSDMGLGTAPAGSVRVYVTLDGADAAVPLTFVVSASTLEAPEPAPGPADIGPADTGPAFDGTVTISPPTVGDPGTPAGRSDARFVTEFTAPADAPLELLATLVPGDPADATGLYPTGPSEESVSLTDLPAWWVADGEAGWEADEGDGTTPDADDAAALARNSLITGAAEAPLREYLRRGAEDEPPAEVPFPSPLGLFDNSGGRPATPEGAAEPVPPPDAVPAGDVPVATADPTNPAEEPISVWSVRAAAIPVVAAVLILARPVAPPPPRLTRRAARTNEGRTSREQP